MTARARTNYGKKTISVEGAQLYNSVPEELKKAYLR